MLTISHVGPLAERGEYRWCLQHRTPPHSAGLSWTCSWPSASFGSGYRGRRERCRIQLAVALLDPSGTEMALHCNADMVRAIVGGLQIKFLSGLAGSQS